MDDHNVQAEQLAPASVPEPLQLSFIERYNIPPALFAILILFIVFVGYQLIGSVVVYFLYGLDPGPESVQGLRIVTALSQLLLILAPTLFFIRFITRKPKEFLRLHVPDIRLFVLPIAGIFSLQQMLQVYMVFQSRIPLPPEIQQFVEQMNELIEKFTKMLAGSSSVPELFWVIVVIALIPAVCEEFLFRGLTQRSFERHLHPLQAAILTGIIFGAYHLNPFTFVPLAVLGIYLGFLAMRAQSLWVSVAAHFYNNAYACVALYFHMDDDIVGAGNPEHLSVGTLLLTFWFFGVIFLVSTLYFMRITMPVEESPAVNESLE
ncbi:MAG: CPBP family intramembrane metalloprotease [Ignavibacteriae bacterium]|nr:CPBP family intramembrane metalloprotease [Ignavibacteria bacterium]MBI3363615.1 CPBP family intramembrane metalloprotease [Ignavibacteriota bacterium]